MKAFGTTSQHCVSCGSKNFSPWAKVHQWELVKCQHCALVFIFPQIEPEQLKLLYSSQTGYGVDLIKQNPQTMELIHQQAKKLLDKVLLSISSGKLLDIGCSTGTFLEYCQQAGFEAEGFEPNSETANFARQKGLSLPQIETIQELEANQYDAITLNDVLEHVLNPAHLIADCWRLLKPGGHLFIHCPNVDSFLSLLPHQLFYPLTSQYAYSEAPYHTFDFSPHTLEYILQRHGFHFKHLEHLKYDLEFMLTRYCALQQEELIKQRQAIKKHTGKQLPPTQQSSDYQQAASYLLQSTYQHLITEAHNLSEDLNFGNAGMFVTAVAPKEPLPYRPLNDSLSYYQFLMTPNWNNTEWQDILKTYLQSFNSEDPVRLVIHYYAHEAQQTPTKEALFQFINGFNLDSPPAILLHMTDEKKPDEFLQCLQQSNVFLPGGEFREYYHQYQAEFSQVAILNTTTSTQLQQAYLQQIGGKQKYAIQHELKLSSKANLPIKYRLNNLRPFFDLKPESRQVYLKQTFQTFTDLAAFHLKQLGVTQVEKLDLNHLCSKAEPIDFELEDKKAVNLLCIYSKQNETGWKESITAYLSCVKPESDMIIYLLIPAHQSHPTIEDELVNCIESSGFELDHIPDISVLGLDTALNASEEQQLFNLIDYTLLPFQILWGWEYYLALAYYSSSQLLTHQFDKKHNLSINPIKSYEELISYSPLHAIKCSPEELQQILQSIT